MVADIDDLVSTIGELIEERDALRAELAQARKALEKLCSAIEREPIAGDLDYPHGHNDWRGWRKKVLRPAAEFARALITDTGRTEGEQK